MDAKCPNPKLAPFALAIVGAILILIKTWISPGFDVPVRQESPIGTHPTFEQELEEALGPVEEVAEGGVGSGAQDLRHEWNGDYEKARREKLQIVNSCEGCGKTKEQLAKIGAHLETHHVISVSRIFSESRDPSLVADVNNLIVLCRGGFSKECHFNLGHDLDGPGPQKPSWSVSNPHVREDAAKMLKESR
ncbi:MAG: hypothetical protein EBW87_00595 [Burkholderiaceae bacterium]|nr:hypothetical protein [Burkholderiaceae bacterium]